MIRKYGNLEMGKRIMPVLSDFITASCKAAVFNEQDRLDDKVRTPVFKFLIDFNKTCEFYYLKVYDQIPIHPKINLGVGILLVLSLCYLYKNNMRLVLQNHMLDKLIFVGIYGAWLVYDFKDRNELYMAYKSYERKYKELIDPQANNGYFFFKRDQLELTCDYR